MAAHDSLTEERASAIDGRRREISARNDQCRPALRCVLPGQRYSSAAGHVQQHVGVGFDLPAAHCSIERRERDPGGGFDRRDLSGGTEQSAQVVRPIESIRRRVDMKAHPA
jgi:hypothetical protein